MDWKRTDWAEDALNVEVRHRGYESDALIASTILRSSPGLSDLDVTPIVRGYESDAHYAGLSPQRRDIIHRDYLYSMPVDPRPRGRDRDERGVFEFDGDDF